MVARYCLALIGVGLMMKAAMGLDGGRSASSAEPLGRTAENPIMYTSKDILFLQRVNQSMNGAPKSVREELLITPYEDQMRAGKDACQYLDSGFLNNTPKQTVSEDVETTEKETKAQYVLNLYLSTAGINTYCPKQLD